MKYSSPKGTKDVLPSQIQQWNNIGQKAAALAGRMGFKEIITPEFESTELFVRGVGQGTDIVTKEMYTFARNDKDSFTLKPEGTAPVIRAYIQNGMGSEPQPVKLFYITSCYRAENPQKGRLRQFHQFGAEIIGSHSPYADAEVIGLADNFLKEMGVGDYTLNINSVGCPKCRANYYALLREFLKDKKAALCEDCRSRIDLNPMRVLDCKNENCQAKLEGAPMMIENLCDECAEHFAGVKAALDAAGMDYVVNPKIVRGCDYYTNTAFEFIPGESSSSQSTLCAGGRYDGLCEELGGEATPGVGFGLGIERLIIAVGEKQSEYPPADIYLAPLGERAAGAAFATRQKLIEAGYSAQTDLMGRSLKAQMKYADKIRARYVLIIGEDELDHGKYILRNMETKQQEEIPADDIAGIISKIAK